MSLASLTIPQFLSIMGICVMSFAGWRLGKTTTVNIDPLRQAGLPSGKRDEIRRMISRRILSDDPDDRSLEFAQAEYDSKTGASFDRWFPLIILGAVLLFCGFYPIPVVSTIVIVLQCITILITVLTWVSDRRRVRNGADLLSEGRFDTSPDASSSEK
jgi:hypothetical protein